MPTTDNTINTPSTEELALWTTQTRDWFDKTGKKYLPKEMREDLAAQGAKWCYGCQTTKAVTEFHKHSGRADGLQSKCRNCKSGSNAEWREGNPEYGREYFRAYRAEHLEEMREYAREYREANYRTHPTMRLSQQLGRGKSRTLEAGGVIEDFGAADLLAWWEEQGIPADRDYFTNELLDPATRSIDHLWAVSDGGPHIRAALVPVTIGTNLAKRAKSPAEFRDYLRSEGIEPAERPDPTPFLIEALAARAAEQDNEEVSPLVQQALSTSVPARAKRTVLVQIEEGADNE